MIYTIGLLIAAVFATAFLVGVCLMLYSISLKYYTDLPEEVKQELESRTRNRR